MEVIFIKTTATRPRKRVQKSRSIDKQRFVAIILFKLIKHAAIGPFQFLIGSKLVIFKVSTDTIIKSILTIVYGI